MQTLSQPLLDYINNICCGNTPPTPKPPTINYTDTTLTFTQGTAVNICPATLTGDPIIVVTVNPSLPAGLTLNPSTGCITGTPTGTSGATSFTFTATNSVGTDTDVISIVVNAAPPTVVNTCYSKTTQSDVFTAQSGFPAKIALTGTGALQETVYGVTYVTGAEADGQYSLRNGSNDLNGLTTSWAIAFNFAIKPTFVPFKIYSQTLLGTAGDTYKGAFWARERASGTKAIFSFRVLDGATVLATGNTGSMATTYTNYKSSNFVMPASGSVTIEIWSENNGTATGNDPLLDGVGLSRVTSTTALYKKVTTNGVDAYFDSNLAPITGAALTQLQNDITSGAAVVVTCTF